MNMGKRILDVIVSLLALGLLSPILVAVALALKLSLGGRVLFRQERIGRFNRPFHIIKFRTMTEVRDGAGVLLPDNARLTRLGAFLRTTSLDELPELINVLRGEMSLVGPRPLYVKYLPYYSPSEQMRHSVRPGITGWAQIHGRNHLPWDARLALDVWYVENRTLWLDVTILFRTVWVVLARDGAAADPDTVEVDLDYERGGLRHDSMPRQS